jgi:hypothetical protein
VGEGICSRGDISEISIQTIVLGNNGDLFVGGEFDSRVWDGHHFVYVYHVARFNGKFSSVYVDCYFHSQSYVNIAKTGSWLPLDGGGELKNTDGGPSRLDMTLTFC